MRLRWSVLLTLALPCAACGAADAGPPQPGLSTAAPVTETANSPAEPYFPLNEGAIFGYATETFSDHPTAGEGLVLTHVHRLSATRGETHVGPKTRLFEYVPDGVVSFGDRGDRFYVLKWPLVVGSNWLGERGASIHIIEANISVTVPAGTFNGCVRTEQLKGGDFPLRTLSTYCPDVGLVLLEAQVGERTERASLKQYGQPIDLGPEGVTRTKTPE